MLSLPPPVIPISVCDASPGPFTTHPIIDKVIGVFICDNFASRVFTVSITSKPCLAQDGQDIILTPLERKLSDFKISLPILISLTGSSDNETLIVSPIPSRSKTPRPIDDFTLPGIKLPDSVIPRCNGYSVFFDNCL